MTVADLIKLCEAALVDHARATPGPWKWWTSNSFRRLSSPKGDGDVLYGYRSPHDGVVDIVGKDDDKDFIVNARAREHLIATALHGLLKALVPAFEKGLLSADGFIDILEENRRLREKLQVPFDQHLCPRGALCVHEVQCPGTQR